MDTTKIDMAWVNKFVEDYIAQDNCGTAWPYAYVLQELKRTPVPVGCGEMILYHSSSWGVYEYTRDKMLEFIRQDEPEFDGEPEDHKEVEANDYVEVWEDVQWFFTKAAYDEHMERNAHNYRRPVRPYVKYFYRDKEAEMILRTLFALAGKDYDQESKK